MTPPHAPLKVHFSDPRNGWMIVRIEAGGKVVEFEASQEPCDWLHKLVKCLTLSLHGIERTVKLETREGEVEFSFAPDPVSRTIKVRLPQSPAVRASVEHSSRNVCEQFLRAFRDLQERSRVGHFREHWKWRFPSEAIERLSLLIVQSA
jgi:hypothetical protein